MLPLIIIGRLIAVFKPAKKEFRIFFFFSFQHIGGAEKVHAQITQAAGGKDCVIYFTRKSHNYLLGPMFRSSGCEVRDISRYTDNKWIYPINIIFRGILSGWINRQTERPVVFNGQNNFGYKLSPWLNTDIPQIDLVHSLNTFSIIRIPFLPFYKQTVIISRKRIADHLELYRSKEIPVIFDSRIEYVSNAITLPRIPDYKPRQPFTVLYVGRGGSEKRIGLIGEIARIVNAADETIRFEMMGDVSDVLEKSRFSFIHFYGNVNDETEINRIYGRASVLILTSETEGFPMVIIEAMARGNVILSTSVGDIPFHVKENINGYLFTDTNNEAAIIREGAERILSLAADTDLVQQIAGNNILYAQQNFGIDRFNNSYRELLRSVKNNN